MRWRWKGNTIHSSRLSKTAQAKKEKLERKHKIGLRFPPVLCEKQGRGHFLFVPPEWGGDEWEFKIGMECYENTPGIMKVG